MTNVLREVTVAGPIAIAPEAAAIAIGLPIAYVILRVIYVAYEDNRASERLEAGGAAR